MPRTAYQDNTLVRTLYQDNTWVRTLYQDNTCVRDNTMFRRLIRTQQSSGRCNARSHSNHNDLSTDLLLKDNIDLISFLLEPENGHLTRETNTTGQEVYTSIHNSICMYMLYILYIFYIIASEASFLVCSMAWIYYICFRPYFVL